MQEPSDTSPAASEVVIQLDQPFEPNSISRPIIQQKLLQELKGTIFSDLKSVTTEEDEAFHDESNNLTYIINGSRGAGKSFFIHRLIHELTGDGNGDKIICHLVSCDPSFLNPSHHFLLSIVAAINHKLEVASVEHLDRDKIMTCRDLVAKLTPGIRRLINPEEYRKEIDEFQVLEITVKESGFPQEMRGMFSEIMKLLCGLYKVKAMLISIDDADIRPRQCMEVLETVRMCLAGPRCIILLAGDLDMYEDRVREFYFCQYNRDYHMMDSARAAHRIDAISSYANQYLQKIAPTHRQFSLLGLRDMYLSGQEIYMKWGEDTFPLFAKLGDVLYLATRLPREEILDAVLTVLTLPVRGILHLMQKLCIKGAMKEDDTLKAEDVYEALFNVQQALFTLPKYNLHISRINNRDAFFRMLLQYCCDTGNLTNGANLLCRAELPEAYRRIALLLAIHVRSYCHTPQDYLYYLLHGPGIIRAYAGAVEQYKATTHTDSPPTGFLDQFLAYFRQEGQKNNLGWGKGLGIVLFDSSNGAAVSNGILRISTDEQLDILLKWSTDAQDGTFQSSYFAISAMLCMVEANTPEYYLSPLSLYDFMYQCITVFARHQIAEFVRKTNSLKKGKAKYSELKNLPLGRLLMGRADKDEVLNGYMHNRLYDSESVSVDELPEDALSALNHFDEDFKELIRMIQLLPCVPSSGRPAWRNRTAESGISKTFMRNGVSLEVECQLAYSIYQWYLDYDITSYYDTETNECSLSLQRMFTIMMDTYNAWDIACNTGSRRSVSDQEFIIKYLDHLRRDIVPRRLRPPYSVWDFIGSFPLVKALQTRSLE